MNFKTYLAILEDEGLKESPLADGVLMEAMKAQKQMNVYKNYEDTQPIIDEVKRLERIKLESIWEAIDLARMNLPDSDMYKLTLRMFKKKNKREYKGFLYEYKLMESQPKVENDAINVSNLSPLEQRVSGRWEKAMERKKAKENAD